MMFSCYSSKIFDECAPKKVSRGLKESVHKRQAALPFLRCPEIRPNAAFLAVDEASGAQQLEMVADRRLPLWQKRRKLADAERLGILNEKLQHAQACRISQRLEPAGQRDGAAGFDRDRDHGRRTATASGRGIELSSGRLCHVTMVAWDIEGCQCNGRMRYLGAITRWAAA